MMTAPTNNALEFATRAHAEALDRSDPFRRFRDEFHIPRADKSGDEEVYLMGNSLGLQPKRTRQYVDEELERWRTLGVRGHLEGRTAWLPYHELLNEPMARIVGGLPQEVVVMNSLTTNLHLMFATFYQPTPHKHKILIESRAFPSDQYAVESQIRWRGLNPEDSLLVCRPQPGAARLDTDAICQQIDDHGRELALVLLPGVQYLTGQMLDIPQITRAARRHDVIVGFDLAHAAGNVELRLHDWDVDFAIWCTYKYLNSGPGAVGGCFVHSRHVSDTTLPRLAGWWGHDKASRFEMPDRFVPIATAEGWQLSNPPILAMAGVRAALEVFDEAHGVRALREKSLRLNDYAIQLLDHVLGDRIELISPRDPAARGCQLSMRAKSLGGSLSLQESLEQRGVATDFRQPDILRAAPVPLYNSFVDVYQFVQILNQCLQVEKR